MDLRRLNAAGTTALACLLTLALAPITACEDESAHSHRAASAAASDRPIAAQSASPPTSAAPPASASPAAPPTAPGSPTPGKSRPSRPATTAPPGSTHFPYGARTSTGTSAVALTFDDGPVWSYTEQLLALLREQGVKATFCVIGKMARTYPDRLREIARDGHTFCNHTDDHNTRLGTMSEAQIRANLQATNDAIHAAVPDAKIAYFRHPGGSWTPRAVKVAAELGMISLHWDVDPQDWTRPGAQAIYNNVTTHTRPGSIVLLHDGGGDRSGTMQAVRSMLPVLKSRFQLIALPPGGLRPSTW